jgi:rSAM/selenodomain-associated transferase 1
MAEGEVIIIFTKPAVPGAVKTRLVPVLTPEQAAEFHLAALSDTISVAGQASEQVEVHVAGGAGDLASLQALHPDHVVRPQLGEGLGVRLSSAFRDAFASGLERVLILGSDHPSLPAQYLAEAWERLRAADVVFGPSRDGGYYCVAIRSRGWPEARSLFEEVPWSTPTVLEASLARARQAGLSVALIPEWYDVDRPEELDLLAREGDARSATVRYLRELAERRA